MEHNFLNYLIKVWREVIVKNTCVNTATFNRLRLAVTEVDQWSLAQVLVVHILKAENNLFFAYLFSTI